MEIYILVILEIIKKGKSACCILLCQAICEKLNHLGINDHSRESALRLIPTITSLNLDDSLYRRKVWDILSRYFIHTKYTLQYISLKFCYIDFYFGVTLLKVYLKIEN